MIMIMTQALGILALTSSFSASTLITRASEASTSTTSEPILRTCWHKPMRISAWPCREAANPPHFPAEDVIVSGPWQVKLNKSNTESVLTAPTHIGTIDSLKPWLSHCPVEASKCHDSADDGAVVGGQLFVTKASIISSGAQQTRVKRKTPSRLSGLRYTPSSLTTPSSGWITIPTISPTSTPSLSPLPTIINAPKTRTSSSSGPITTPIFPTSILSAGDGIVPILPIGNRKKADPKDGSYSAAPTNLEDMIVSALSIYGYKFEEMEDIEGEWREEWEGAGDGDENEDNEDLL